MEYGANISKLLHEIEPELRSAEAAEESEISGNDDENR